jgi:hypothetical protein
MHLSLFVLLAFSIVSLMFCVTAQCVLERPRGSVFIVSVTSIVRSTLAAFRRSGAGRGSTATRTTAGLRAVLVASSTHSIVQVVGLPHAKQSKSQVTSQLQRKTETLYHVSGDFAAFLSDI